MNYVPETKETTVRTGMSEVQGLSIFYREAGKPGNPKLVLLHGFPASSHQYRNLIPALATKFHVVAMDYPGFGNSDMPDPAKYPYTFDKISEVVEAFLKKRGFTRFGLRAGLRWAGGLSDPLAQPGLAGVVDHPEHQRL